MINTAHFEHAMVGNLCATSPMGMAVVYDKKAGFVLEPQYGENPENDCMVASGTAAPDGSFFQRTFGHVGAIVTLTWSHNGQGAFVARLSADGKPSSHLHYTWGALFPLIGVEALCDMDADSEPLPYAESGTNETISIRNIPFVGALYRIDCRDGNIEVTGEG